MNSYAYFAHVLCDLGDSLCKMFASRTTEHFEFHGSPGLAVFFDHTYRILLLQLFAIYGVTNVVVKCLYYECTLTTPFRLYDDNEQCDFQEPRYFLVEVLPD